MKHSPKRHLLVLVFLTFSLSGLSVAQDVDIEAGEFAFTGHTLTLPLVKNQIHPLILVGRNASERYQFVVDTGASVNVIDSDIAYRLGYEVVGETEIGAPGGRKISANIVRVPFLLVGDAKIEDAEFVTMNLNVFSGGLMQGVLGLPLFEDYLLTFDRPADEIRVSRASLLNKDAGVLTYNDADSHIQIDINVEDHIVATHVDTGSMASFTLPVEMMTNLALNEVPKKRGRAIMVGGPRNIQRAQLDGSIRFAGLSYDQPTIGFIDPSPVYGNLGSGILGKLVVSIDQQNHLISFRKPDAQHDNQSTNPAPSEEQNPRRLGVGFRGVPGGETLTVASVADGSVGEEAGFAIGDTLSSLNGRPASDYDMSQLGELIRSSAPLMFEIERDGNLMTIEIP